MGDIIRQGCKSQGGPSEEVNLKVGELLGTFFKVGELDSTGVGAGRHQLSPQRVVSSPAWLEQRFLRWMQKERLGKRKEQPHNRGP